MIRIALTLLTLTGVAAAQGATISRYNEYGQFHASESQLSASSTISVYASPSDTDAMRHTGWQFDVLTDGPSRSGWAILDYSYYSYFFLGRAAVGITPSQPGTEIVSYGFDKGSKFGEEPFASDIVTLPITLGQPVSLGFWANVGAGAYASPSHGCCTYGASYVRMSALLKLAEHSDDGGVGEPVQMQLSPSSIVGSEIPEPSTFAAGMVGIGFLLYARRKAA